MNSNISIVHVGLFLFLSYTGMAQIEGDVTGDNFVDASDYFTLKKIAIGSKEPTRTSDLNHDGKVNVLDLLILENYIYKNGPDPPGGNPKLTKYPVTLIPGKVDPAKKTIEILIQNKELIGAFQFDLLGLGNIEAIKGGSAISHDLTVSFSGTRIMGILDKGRALPSGEALLLEVRFSSDNFEKACITQPLVLTPEAATFEIILGECIAESATMKGLSKLESLLVNGVSSDPDADINHDGYTDISDLVYLENFLLRDGPPPPGNDEKLSKKLRLQIESVDLDAKKMSIYASYSKTVAGIQFVLAGVENITAVNAPKLTEHGFKIDYHSNRVVAHIQEGFPLFPDKGILMEIEYDNSTQDEACLNNPIVVNAYAATYQILLGECISLVKVVPGCMDTSATNYNPLANKEDGSCEYPAKPVKLPKEKKPKVEKPPKEKPARQKGGKPEAAKLPKKKPDKKAGTTKKQVESIFEITVKGQETAEVPQAEKEKPKKGEHVKEKDEKSNKSKVKEKVKKEKIKKEEPRPPVIIDAIKQGVIIPFLTSEEREKLSELKKGLMVYDTTLELYIYYDGKTWKIIGQANDSKKVLKKVRGTGLWKNGREPKKNK